MIWLKWLGSGIGVLVVVAIGAAAYGSSRWGEGTRALRARLEAARTPPSPPRYEARELDGLPAPVQRYFRTVLKDGQPIIAAASLKLSGTINMSEAAEQWKPFTSDQRVITRRPGFDWDARIMMLPFVPVHVHDAYVAGEGILRGALFGLVPVVNMAGTPEMARGELLRWVGDWVGAVGNSGNTDEPHLHIHAQQPATTREPMSGNPLPVSFSGRVLVRNDRVSVP